jgi:LmbE family N-acetylglucosaminyl deacetylase
VAQNYQVVSPHLDDAALSCSLFLAANPGSSVITVFAGGPPSVRPLTQWDKTARYFPEGADVVGVRRGEDISAAALVNATTHHLTYWDRQYRTDQYRYNSLPDDELSRAIAKDLVSRVSPHSTQSWLVPLGLGHPDHRIAAEAGLIFASSYSGSVYLYEELPYSVENPTEAAEKRRLITERGFVLQKDTTLRFSDDRALKAAVVRCHASQRHSLGRRLRTAVRAQERIWRLVPVHAL